MKERTASWRIYRQTQRDEFIEALRGHLLRSGVRLVTAALGRTKNGAVWCVSVETADGRLHGKQVLCKHDPYRCPLAVARKLIHNDAPASLFGCLKVLLVYTPLTMTQAKPHVWQAGDRVTVLPGYSMMLRGPHPDGYEGPGWTVTEVYLDYVDIERGPVELNLHQRRCVFEGRAA